MSGIKLSRDERPASHRIVESLAAAMGVDPIELEPPLYEVVETDALDTLLDSGAEIRFEYRDHLVCVDSDGTVTVDDVTYHPDS